MATRRLNPVAAAAARRAARNNPLSRAVARYDRQKSAKSRAKKLASGRVGPGTGVNGRTGGGA